MGPLTYLSPTIYEHINLYRKYDFTNPTPQLGDLRESGAIEQDADTVLMIYRDDYYNPNTREIGIAEINIAKQRAGPTGTIKTTFAPKYTRFDNLPHGYTNTPSQ